MTLQEQTPLAEPRDVDAIPLPEVTRRTETRRRRQERKRERRRRLLLVSAGLTAVVVLVSLLVAAWPSSKSNDGDEGTGTGAAAAAAVPAVLLVQQDAAGNAVSLMLVVPGAKAKGGALVLIPPGTMTEVASLGLEPVGKSLALGGAQRLDATVENLLGATIGEVLVFDDARLAALVQPAGPLTVRIPERVEQVAPGGEVDVLYEPGPRKVEPTDVPRLLATKGQASDLSRLARHQAFWDAWLDRMRSQRSAIPQPTPGLHKALVALVAGDVVTRVLPVQALGTTPDGELYQVDSDALRTMVAGVFPGSRPGGAVRPRLQVLNGTGAVGLAQRVADKLLAVGVEVKLTGNAGRLDYNETQIVFYRRDDQAVAERVQKALGVGRLVLSRNPLDVVDVTIIVGRDFKSQ